MCEGYPVQYPPAYQTLRRQFFSVYLTGVERDKYLFIKKTALLSRSKCCPIQHLPYMGPQVPFMHFS